MLQWAPLSTAVVFITVDKCGFGACVFERLVILRRRWYLIEVRGSALWVGEDEVGTLGIGGRCSDGERKVRAELRRREGKRLYRGCVVDNSNDCGKHQLRYVGRGS